MDCGRGLASVPSELNLIQEIQRDDLKRTQHALCAESFWEIFPVHSYKSVRSVLSVIDI